MSLTLLTPIAQAHTPSEDSAAPTTPQAISIEVNQAISQASGKYVAGKDTTILVYLDAAVAVDTATQTVAVKRDGAAVATLTPQPSDQPTNPLVFICPNRAACGDWAAGTYSFDFTMAGTTTSLPNIALVARRQLRLLAVPVKTSYGDTVKSVAVEDWKTAGDFIAKVYPVAPANFDWKLGPEVDASTQDINVAAGQLGVWQALAALQPMECTVNPKAANCYDKIIGFVAERPNGNLNGYTYGNPANIVAIQSGMRRTVAHEVGHTFGLGDEYNGGQFNCPVNPTPPNYVGRDFNNPESSNFSCTNSTTQAFEEGGGTGVRVLAAQAHPYEIGGRGLLTDDLGDLMGNYSDVSRAWISPDVWKQIFDQSAPVAAPGSADRPQTAPTRVVAASGIISASGAVTLEPWFSFTTTEVINAVSGGYTIAAVDSGGHTLASQGFNLNFNVFDQPPLTEAPFDLAVPYPAGTAAFRILKGTTLLKTLTVPAHAPSVHVTSPTAGQHISGTTTITWQGSHPDGVPLHYIVEYNATGREDDWITLAWNITDTHWTDDFSTLPGGTQAVILITASDGVNSTQAFSDPFNVPAVKPEVFIDEGAPAAVYRAGEEVVLSGVAYDLQDGTLTSDTSLTWSSDKDGELGGGELLYVTGLALGHHKITLTATNSFGSTATQTVGVTIVAPGKARFFPVTLDKHR